MKPLLFPRMPVGATPMPPGRRPSWPAIVDVSPLRSQAGESRVLPAKTLETHLRRPWSNADQPCLNQVPCCFLIRR